MTEAIVLSKSDIRKILAEYYSVEIEKVLPSKYSFTIIKSDGREIGCQEKWYTKVVHKHRTLANSCEQNTLKNTLNHCKICNY